MSELPEWLTLPDRKSPRARLHDYRQGGCYFITIRLSTFRPMLGRLADDRPEIILTSIGKMVESNLLNLPLRYAALKIDCYVLMPDHIHFIAELNGLEANRPNMLEVIKTLKSLTGLRYLKWRSEYGKSAWPEKLWQRSFHDRYLRNETELYLAREYIANNVMALFLERRAVKSIPESKGP